MCLKAIIESVFYGKAGILNVEAVNYMVRSNLICVSTIYIQLGCIYTVWETKGEWFSENVFSLICLVVGKAIRRWN